MKCRQCGLETYLPFRCPYCEDQFCTDHRLPENHNCPRMDLARAQKHEDATVVGGPTYEYKVTYGRPYQTKGRVYFSPKEVKHLILGTLLVIGISLSFGFESRKYTASKNSITNVANDTYGAKHMFIPLFQKLNTFWLIKVLALVLGVQIHVKNRIKISISWILVS